VPVEGGRLAPAHDTSNGAWHGLACLACGVQPSPVQRRDGARPAVEASAVGAYPELRREKASRGDPGAARAGRRRKSRHEDTAKCRRNPV